MARADGVSYFFDVEYRIGEHYFSTGYQGPLDSKIEAGAKMSGIAESGERLEAEFVEGNLFERAWRRQGEELIWVTPYRQIGTKTFRAPEGIESAQQMFG